MLMRQQHYLHHYLAACNFHKLNKSNYNERNDPNKTTPLSRKEVII